MGFKIIWYDYSLESNKLNKLTSITCYEMALTNLVAVVITGESWLANDKGEARSYETEPALNSKIYTHEI